VHCSVKITALGPWSLKRALKGFSKLVSNFKELAKTLRLIISSTRKQKILHTIGICTESTYLILLAFKNLSSRDTITLKKQQKDKLRGREQKYT
jgi:hypothetical protein